MIHGDLLDDDPLKDPQGHDLILFTEVLPGPILRLNEPNFLLLDPPVPPVHVEIRPGHRDDPTVCLNCR